VLQILPIQGPSQPITIIQSSYIKLVDESAIIIPLGKRNKDFTTVKLNISKPSRNMTTLLLSLSTLKQLVTTSNGTIRIFWRPARLTTVVSWRRPCFFRSCSQHWMPMSAVRAITLYWKLKKLFTLLPVPFKRLKFLLHMFSCLGSRPRLIQYK